MVFLVIWLALLAYAMYFAPSDGGGPTFAGLLTGEWSGVDPLVLVVFNSLGIFPMVFLTILLRNDRYRWPAWSFALVSMGAGAFALLPYFAFGDRGKERPNRTPRWLLSFLRSKFWLYLLLAIFIANGLLLLQGFSLEEYGALFRTSSLVSVMTVDWFVIWGLSVYAIYRFYPEAQKKGLAFIPIAGPVLVLLLNGKNSNDQRQRQLELERVSHNSKQHL